MVGLSVSAPKIANHRRLSVKSAVEWALFLAAVGMVYATIWGRVRTTGPAVLLGLTILTSAAQLLDRKTATRRAAVLLLTFVVAYLFRNYTSGLVAHRVGRFSLVTGLGLTVLLSLPTSLIARLSEISIRLRARPTDRVGILVALFGVALPASFFYAKTTHEVWTGDTLPVVPTVVQLYQHGDRELSRFEPPSCFRRWDAYGPGHAYFIREVPCRAGRYSAYPAGMEAFACPVVALAGATGHDLMDDELHLSIEKLTAAITAGCSLGMFFLIALHFGPPSAAFAVTWLMAAGSVFASTLGLLLWQQGGVVFWMLLALLVEFRANGRPGWKGLLAQSLACGWMLACRPSAVTFLVPFGLWVLARDWRRGLLLPLLAALWYLPWGVLYWSIYRTPFGPSMAVLAERWFPGENLWGVLVSPGRGLLVYQPWLLLLILRMIPAAREGDAQPRGWTAFAVGMVGLHLLLIASWPIWWGGLCYGSRLVAEVVPILALFLVRPVAWLLSRRAGWVVLAAVGLFSFAIHAPCLYYDAWLWNSDPVTADADPSRLWDWARPPFLYNLVR
jgi:hypothetical protein